VDEALKKLAHGGDDYPGLKEYSRALIKKWDNDNDGIISFQELCDGLKALDINLQLKDRVQLMKRLDMNTDGEITDIELYKAFSGVETSLMKETVDQTLRKIVSGSDEYANMKEYSKALIKRFDGNHDGMISF
jgi:Ca2+-binding EF-hand superfamily protein